MEFGINNWRTFEEGVQKEYLVTNGIGGFCSSTIIGANIRKYHGLLDVALVPPVKRILLLSKLDEGIKIGDRSYKLASNEFIGKKDEGYLYLRKFSHTPVPTFVYGIEDVKITKEIAMAYGKNTVAITYHVKTGSEEVELSFEPYVNFRDHHGNSKQDDFDYDQTYRDNVLALNHKDGISLKISSNACFHKDEKWSLPMFYRNEAYRGQDPIDCHFIPGYHQFKVLAHSQGTITFVATIEEDLDLNAIEIIENEKKRKSQLIEQAGYQDEFLKDLVWASDQFIVQRESTNTKTVIAGYPWFTDWGRDTMIALPGLTLATKRFDEAKEILLTFIKYIHKGIIPNMFPDENIDPMYNTVDGTLWYFQAVHKYLNYTQDEETVRTKIYPYLKDIIEHHIQGTLYDIYLDKDGLLSAGGPGTQLTWMDVKVKGWVVTPRHGKAVEINALWYNALKIMENLANRFGDDGSHYLRLAEQTKQSFNEVFWNPSKACLYDVIQGDKAIDKIRPNQIIAIGLPYSLLNRERSKKVLEIVQKHLYTPYGLRSLSKEEPEYIGQYGGDVLQRDGAYHQGTIWPWLIGPFVDAYARVHDYSKESRKEVKAMLRLFSHHMEDACIGSINEILDGDEPFGPRGCPAQAWSVAEVLRAYVELVVNRNTVNS